MIGQISGRLTHRGADHVLIDTGGVGYVVHCSDRTLAALPEAGGPVALYTDLLVREDLLQLFGFRTLAEREWHRLLSSVQGVSARGALAILGTLGPEGVARALSLGDVNAVRATSGIGPKIAQRIILELQAKAPAVMAMGAEGAQPPQAAAMSTTALAQPVPVIPDAAPEGGPGAAAQADALSALVNLGYGLGEAAAAIAEAETADGSLATADLIRAALRRLAPQA